MTSVAAEELGGALAMMARVVQSQLVTAVTAFFRRDVGLAQKVCEKDDQVDNLLSLIEEQCFEKIALEGSGATPRARQLRGVVRVAMNLEKLGDYAVNVAEQAVHVSRLRPQPPPFDLAGPARVALAALDEVIASFTDQSAEKAKDACRYETELDRQYKDALAEAFRRLGRPGQDPAFIITNLFVAKFFERIGDSILNIGETTLFILTGERLKLHQYLHLEEMVGDLRPEADGGVEVHQIWGGISGARLARLSVGVGQPLIWKEGAEAKIEEEVQATEEWNRLIPGIAPDLKGRLQRDGRESVLREFLDGVLLRDVYLARSWEDKARVTRRLLETMREIWLLTGTSAAPRIDYCRQIRDRLGELYAVHPRLRRLRESETRVFGIRHRSLTDLLAELGAVEARLAPPVTVRIHGDFNTNNVIYDARGDRVRFIDVHRSGPGDYLQDVSVFVVSNLRTPIQAARIQGDVARVNDLVVEFAAEFARGIGDRHFGARLPLAQARSFITSARVVADAELARDLYLRGVRLLDQCAQAAA